MENNNYIASNENIILDEDQKQIMLNRIESHFEDIFTDMKID